MDSIKYVFVISNKFRYFYTTQVFTTCLHWKGGTALPSLRRTHGAPRPRPNEQEAPNATSSRAHLKRSPSTCLVNLGVWGRGVGVGVPPCFALRPVPASPRESPGGGPAGFPLPSRLGDDHLGADLVEALPELGSLQVHPRRLRRGRRRTGPRTLGGAAGGGGRGGRRETLLAAACGESGGSERGRGRRARERGPPDRGGERTGTTPSARRG